MTEPLTQATLTPTTDERGRDLSLDQQAELALTVHFNPESMRLVLTNTIKKGRGQRPTQTVSDSVAKLSMDLVFDTTTTGEDVRQHTHQIAQMMDPVVELYTRRGRRRERKVPAVVVFEWGTTKFEGYIDGYTENIEFFSAEGVPLRSTLSLSLTQQERTFAPNDEVSYDRSGVSRELELGAEATTAQLGSQQSLHSQAGGAAEARRLGAQNGLENLRLPEKSEIQIIDELERSAQSFAAGVSGGLTIAADSPFAGLRIQAESTASRPRQKLSAGVQTPGRAAAGIGPKTAFGIGGKISNQGSSSMCTDVGVNADIGNRIKFEE